MPRGKHREVLIDEGLKLIQANGFEATGVQEITAASGVPKGSFYNYFKSKEHFGAEVIRHYANRLLARMDAILGAGEDADAMAALRRYYSAGLAAYEQGGAKDGCLLCNLGAELGGSSALFNALPSAPAARIANHASPEPK